MSASLVGSEMCIRDSLLAKGCAQPRTLQASSLRQVGSPLGQRAMVSDPVSYTHLTLPTICSV
eukprot:13225049-Alexandrium_andersonii.AAC.1